MDTVRRDSYTDKTAEERADMLSGFLEQVDCLLERNRDMLKYATYRALVLEVARGKSGELRTLRSESGSGKEWGVKNIESGKWYGARSPESQGT